MADQLRPWYVEETHEPPQSGTLQMPFNYYVEGGADPHGSNFGGNLNFDIPFSNGSLSGGVRGNVYNYDNQMGGTLSGSNLQYNTDDFSLGGEYFNYGPFENPETVLSPYGAPTTGQGFMGRGTFRYADGGDVPLDEKRFFTPRDDAIVDRGESTGTVDNYLRNSPLFGYRNPASELYNLLAPATETKSDRPMRYRVLDTLGAAVNLPVRMATLGEYNTADLVQGLTGRDFPAVRESEQRFYENNQPLMRPFQAIGEALPLGIKGLGYAPVLRPPLPNKEAVKDVMLRLAANEEGSVPARNYWSNEQPELPSVAEINQKIWEPQESNVSPIIGQPKTKVQPLERDVSHYGYYSAADEALKNAQRKKGNAQAWINEFKKAGVPNAEMQWRKINEYLASKPNQEITKEELQDHFKKYPLEIVEETHTTEGMHPSAIRDMEKESLWSAVWEGNYDDQIKIKPNTEDADYPFDLYLNDKKIDSYNTEEKALEAGREKIGDMYSQEINNMSIKELLKTYDTNLAERTSQYVGHNDTRPQGGSDFEENVLRFKNKQYENLNNKSKFLKYGGVHPDEIYEYPLGWRLSEQYTNLPTGENMLVAHELQSKMGQAISGQKKVLPPEQVEKLKNEYAELNAKIKNSEYGLTKIKQAENSDYSVYDLREVDDPNLRRSIRSFLETIEDIKIAIKNDADLIERYKRVDPNALATERDIKLSEKRIKELENSMREHELLVQNIIKDNGLEGKIKKLDPSTGFDEYDKFHKDREQIVLKRNEINSRLDSHNAQADKEILAAPIVDSNSGMDPLIKRALHDAAEKDLDVFAVSDADRLYRRWGDEGTASLYPREDVTNDGKVTGKISDIMLKLARQHNPQAQIERFYPAQRSYSDEPIAFEPERLSQYSGGYGNHPNTLADVLINKEQHDLPFNFVDESGEPNKTMFGPLKALPQTYKIHNPISHIGTSFVDVNPNKILSDPFSSRFDKAQKALTENRRPVYTLRGAQDMVQGGNLYFSTKERAEEAMKIINEAFKNREKEGPLKSIQKWEEKNGNPYFGIRLTPEMKKSILTKGFPLFALLPLLYNPNAQQSTEDLPRLRPLN